MLQALRTGGVRTGRQNYLGVGGGEEHLASEVLSTRDERVTLIAENALEKEKNHLKYTALRKIIIFIRETDTRAQPEGDREILFLRIRRERCNHDAMFKRLTQSPGVYNKVKCAAASRGPSYSARVQGPPQQL